MLCKNNNKRFVQKGRDPAVHLKFLPFRLRIFIYIYLLSIRERDQNNNYQMNGRACYICVLCVTFPTSNVYTDTKCMYEKKNLSISSYSLSFVHILLQMYDTLLSRVSFLHSYSNKKKGVPSGTFKGAQCPMHYSRCHFY